MFTNRLVEVVLRYSLQDLTCSDYLWGRVKELAYFQRFITSKTKKKKNIFQNNDSRVKRSPSKLSTKGHA